MCSRVHLVVLDLRTWASVLKAPSASGTVFPELWGRGGSAQGLVRLGLLGASRGLLCSQLGVLGPCLAVLVPTGVDLREDAAVETKKAL